MTFKTAQDVNSTHAREREAWRVTENADLEMRIAKRAADEAAIKAAEEEWNASCSAWLRAVGALQRDVKEALDALGFDLDAVKAGLK